MQIRRFATCFAFLLGCQGGPPSAPSVPPGIDTTAIDTTADPCRDFYQYACGGYIASHPIGPDGSVVARRYDAFYATEDAERRLLADMMAGSSQAPEEQLLRAYNGACLAAAVSRDRATLDQLLAQIDTVQPGARLATAVAALHDAGVDALFSLGTARDLMHPTTIIADASAGGMGLPDRTYYLDAPSATVLPAYRQHVSMLSTLLGVSDPLMADAVVRVESTLAAATLTPTERRDPLATYHIQPLTTLVQAVPHFDLQTYLQAEKVPTLTSLNVTMPAFFDALETVLAQTTVDDLKRYLRWRTIEALAGFLDDPAVAEEYRFHAGTFQGFTQPLPRDEYCLRSTVGALPWTMSAIYVARVAGGLQARAQPLVDRVRQTLRDDLASIDWLDEPTRAAATAKLDAVRAGVSAPDEFSAYESDLTNLPSSFATAVTLLRERGRARSLTRIGTTDTRAWFLSPITVNAAYSSTLNAINLPAAILQQPLFDPGFPDAVNFGGIGSVVGHEFTHGFDDAGRKFDATGAFVDWWTPAIKAQFDARAQCVVQQYAAIEPLPGAHIDGQLTLGENIADIAGVKLAYTALHPTGAKLGDLTDAQLYFLAYAQEWCGNQRPESLTTALHTDPHSPASARVNAVLADTPEFAAAFSCRAGAPMAPTTVCAVW